MIRKDELHFPTGDPANYLVAALCLLSKPESCIQGMPSSAEQMKVNFEFGSDAAVTGDQSSLAFLTLLVGSKTENIVSPG